MGDISTLARRYWFLARSLPIRFRFMTGKASFVEAEIGLTTHNVLDQAEASRPSSQRLLSHYQLSTRKPRTGSQGWRLFEERVGLDHLHQTVELECAYCGHLFIIQILSSIDPLAVEIPGQPSPGKPASYSSDWFTFMHRDYQGSPSLSCTHCEQKQEPKVRYLAAS
ncbi:MAG: hypothetical protein HY921_12370 [Elusimicrobia bacterium]|nr:hypothetical protein [Elusimicrobiota bacterium]